MLRQDETKLRSSSQTHGATAIVMISSKFQREWHIKLRHFFVSRCLPDYGVRTRNDVAKAQPTKPKDAKKSSSVSSRMCSITHTVELMGVLRTFRHACQID
ncbi:hypothetical protein ACH79_39910 [Bradyrhizobium sp. CCBAU 051011]|nr:hypothetical protein ACH79_39910 [Bradyrhizobium sp. CCBAU 051011]